jgi:Co/Zn/Cd efflux system component
MLKLLNSVGLSLLAADLKRHVRHLVRSGILGVVGTLLAVIALCFFLVAAHLALSRWLDPIASAAIIGGALLAIALILFFAASRPFKVRRPASNKPETDTHAADALREGMARFGEAAGASDSPLRNPAVQTAGIALITGFLLGRRSRRRKD